MTDLKNHRDASCPGKASQQGFSLMEVLLVIILLAVAVVPMLESFSPSLNALNQAEQTTIRKHQALGTLNRVLTMEYEVLESNSTGSNVLNDLFGSSEEESFLYEDEDSPDIRIIIEKYVDSDGNEQDGLLEIEVSVGMVTLNTRKAEH
ncbi:MAG: type II secretion system GspH family protein [Spirochaetales bacterium]|nr:type II secretion system GspH family protein [Spirochaetales bacterium]